MEKTNISTKPKISLDECERISKEFVEKRKQDALYEAENKKRLAEAKNLETEMKNKQMYEKLRDEIIDGTKIKEHISKLLSKNRQIFCYFSTKTKLNEDYITINKINTMPIHIPNGIYTNYDLLDDDSIMTSKSANDIFISTKYGDKTLVQLFEENFTYPIRMEHYRNRFDSYIRIRWDDLRKKPILPNVRNVPEKEKCIIM